MILRANEKGSDREPSPERVGPQGRKLVAKIVLKANLTLGAYAFQVLT